MTRTLYVAMGPDDEAPWLAALRHGLPVRATRFYAPSVEQRHVAERLPPTGFPDLGDGR